MPRAVCFVLKQVPVVPWTIQVAALMTRAVRSIGDSHKILSVLSLRNIFDSKKNIPLMPMGQHPQRRPHPRHALHAVLLPH